MVARRAGHRGRGVFLVDVIVASILLGVALAVMLSMAGRAIDSQATGERLQIAAMLADEQLNTVLLYGPEEFGARAVAEGPCDAPFEAYRYRVDIGAGGEGGEAFEVTATIQWSEYGRPRSLSIETMIAPRLGDEPDPDRKPKKAVERDQV